GSDPALLRAGGERPRTQHAENDRPMTRDTAAHLDGPPFFVTFFVAPFFLAGRFVVFLGFDDVVFFVVFLVLDLAVLFVAFGAAAVRLRVVRTVRIRVGARSAGAGGVAGGGVGTSFSSSIASATNDAACASVRTRLADRFSASVPFSRVTTYSSCTTWWRSR